MVEAVVQRATLAVAVLGRRGANAAQRTTSSRICCVCCKLTVTWEIHETRPAAGRARGAARVPTALHPAHACPRCWTALTSTAARWAVRWRRPLCAAHHRRAGPESCRGAQCWRLRVLLLLGKRVPLRAPGDQLAGPAPPRERTLTCGLHTPPMPPHSCIASVPGGAACGGGACT